MIINLVLYSAVANALVPPWWIIDGAKTWPKKYWIGAQFEPLNQKSFTQIKEVLNKKFAEHKVTIHYFEKPRITLGEGIVLDDDAIRSLYHVLEGMHWDAEKYELQIKKVAVDSGVVGLRISFDELPEWQTLRRQFNKAQAQIKNLAFFVKRHGFIVELGYIKEKNSGFIRRN